MKTFNLLLQTLISWMLRLIPLLTPIPTAYVTWRAATESLDLPSWVAIIMALAVEGLGFSATDTAMTLWDYNETRRKTDLEAPFSLAVGTVFFYIGVVLGLTVLVEVIPSLRHWSLVIFPLMTLDAAIVWGLHTGHQHRIAVIEAGKKERKAKRQKRRQAVSKNVDKNLSNIPKVDSSLDKLQEGKRLKKAARLDRVLAIYRDNPQEKVTVVARQLSASRQTIYNDLQELEDQDLVRRNGNGIEVL